MCDARRQAHEAEAELAHRKEERRRLAKESGKAHDRAAMIRHCVNSVGFASAEEETGGVLMASPLLSFPYSCVQVRQLERQVTRLEGMDVEVRSLMRMRGSQFCRQPRHTGP